MFKFLKEIVKFFAVEPVRKVLALIFAFGLWLFVAIDGTYNYEREILVNYTNLSDTYIITDSVSKIKVIFSGRGKNLFGIWTSPPKAICNLSQAVPGRNVVSTKDFIAPIKDVVINYNEKFINVEIDERITKFVRPIISIKGNLKNGYAISSLDILDTIVATGAKKFLQKLNEVFTESLDVKNQSGSFERSLKIASPLEPIKFSRENITVRVTIDTLDRITFTHLSINILKNPTQYVRLYNRDLDTLVISGARSRLNILNKEEVMVRIKVADLVSGTYYLSPEIILPEFLNAVYYIPQRIRITVY